MPAAAAAAAGNDFTKLLAVCEVTPSLSTAQVNYNNIML